MTRSSFLPFSPPTIGDEEIAQVVETMKSGWLTTGPRTKAFEQEFARYLGAPAALALNSCTSGLHVALATLGLGPRDEVITTTMTFASTVNVIEHVGATPVLADVEPDTLNIDPTEVARKTTPKTRAVIAVHYSGHPADLGSLRDLCTSGRIHLIEDAAHSLPARFQDRLIGSHSNLASFSFYATKNLTTGEGGMLTGDPELLATARSYSLHGMSGDAWKRYDRGGSWYYEITRPGFKCNMTDIQAAIGLEQLKKLERFHQRRREIAAAYTRAFARFDALEPPTERGDVQHAWHLYILRLRPDRLSIDRDQFIRELADRNIGTSVHFIPIHTHPYYRDRYGYKPNDFPVAYDAFTRMLSLPLHPGLSESDVGDVIEAVTDVVTRHRR